MYNLLETALIQTFSVISLKNFWMLKGSVSGHNFLRTQRLLFFFYRYIGVVSHLVPPVVCHRFYDIVLFFCSDKCQLCVFLKGLLTRFYRLFRYLY